MLLCLSEEEGSIPFVGAIKGIVVDSLEEEKDADGYTDLDNVLLTAVLKSAFIYVATAQVTNGMDMGSEDAIKIVAESERKILEYFYGMLSFNGYTIVRKEPSLERLMN